MISMDQDYLFDAKLLSSDICNDLPNGYLMRPLAFYDYDKKFLDCLGELTTMGEISREQFQERFREMKSMSGKYFTIVIEELSTSRIVASGTVLVEIKFIRGCGKVGHVEDIVVHESQRGKSFGKKLINQLTHISNSMGCYKVILCCSDKNVGFYEKCGYQRKEAEMAKYF